MEPTGNHLLVLCAVPIQEVGICSSRQLPVLYSSKKARVLFPSILIRVSANYPPKLVRQVFHCFSLLLFHLLFPVCVKSAKPSVFILCLKNFNCIFPMLSASILFLSIFCRTSSLARSSVDGFLSIIRIVFYSGVYAPYFAMDFCQLSDSSSRAVV